MPNRIELRNHYTLTYEIPRESEVTHVELLVKVPEAVQLRLDFAKHEALASCRPEVSDRLLSFLVGTSGGPGEEEDPPDAVAPEFSRVYCLPSDAMNRTMELIRYCYRLQDAPQHLFSSRGPEWRIPDGEWKPVPQKLKGVIDIQSRRRLDAQGVRGLQLLLDRGFEPLAGQGFWLRARAEADPRLKWIDASIAAELAVKDALVRLEPRLETLLRSVPSPPLRKLYGEILAEYGGKKSPRCKEIHHGSEVRNSLVHRGENPEVDDQEAIVYTFDVEEAIFHLLTLVYPDDEAVRHFFRPRGRVG